MAFLTIGTLQKYRHKELIASGAFMLLSYLIPVVKAIPDRKLISLVSASVSICLFAATAAGYGANVMQAHCLEYKNTDGSKPIRPWKPSSIKKRDGASGACLLTYSLNLKKWTCVVSTAGLIAFAFSRYATNIISPFSMTGIIIYGLTVASVFSNAAAMGAEAILKKPSSSAAAPLAPSSSRTPVTTRPQQTQPAPLGPAVDPRTHTQERPTQLSASDIQALEAALTAQRQAGSSTPMQQHAARRFPTLTLYAPPGAPTGQH